MRELIEHYGREKEAIVRGMIAKLLGRLAKIPGVSGENLVDEIIPLVKAEGIKAFQCISTCCSESEVFLNRSDTNSFNFRLRQGYSSEILARIEIIESFYAACNTH